jgi:hypothetical protein
MLAAGALHAADGGLGNPVIQVTPVYIAPPANVLPMPAAPAATPSPPVSVQRPTTITACDPTGCWDTTGARLPRQGPVVRTPSGACVPQPGATTCP